MKTLLMLSILFSLNIHATPTLICNSHDKIEGWDGSSTFEKVQFTAYIDSDVELESAVINGAFKSDMRDLLADQNTEKKYKRVRFSLLEDAWCWFHILLPKNFTKRTNNFAGSIQYSCEGAQYSYQYIDMDCFIID